MWNEVSHHYASVGDGHVHYAEMGTGDPVVLLHGWPQTCYAWRKIMPTLASRYRVIAPDLRGLGDSARPVSGYDKYTVASDIEQLLRNHLKLDAVYLVGHDWGGPVAFALSAYFPGLVRKLVMLDAAVPGDGSGTFSQSGRRWHHAFHQTPDLPEALIRGREDIYYRWFFEHYGYRPGSISEADVQEYLRTYAHGSTLRTGLAYYRSIDDDIARNTAYLREHRLSMPVLAYGGGQAFGRGAETLSSMRRVAEQVDGGVIDDCGHWIAEEQPEFLQAQLLAFFNMPDVI